MKQMKKSMELREKRAALAAEAMTYAESNAEKFENIMKEVNALEGQIERIERAEKLDAELRSTTRPPLEAIGNGNNGPVNEERAAAHKAAFRSYLVTGDASELRTYGPMSDAAQGAYIVPQGFRTELEVALKAFGGVRKVARQISTATGNSLSWPTVTDVTVVGEQLGENSAVAQANPTFNSITLNAWKYSTKMVNVSNELLQDSAFDIEAYLREAFVNRIGRIQNQKFTIGAGTTEPLGISAAATAGPTTATTLVVTYDDLVELEHSVDPAYRTGAKFMFSDAILKQIKKLKDSQGHPLWVSGMTAGAPDTILGYQYVINQDMPSVASGHNLALFGALDKYLIRDVKELAVIRLNERYADLNQTAYIGFARADANLIDAGTHPVKTLVSA
jgi:HK97 family phage major capsid protein